MFYLRCSRCGHLNPADSEHLLFCQSCNRKLINNFSDWHARFPLKSFQDFRREQCVEVDGVLLEPQSIKSTNTAPRLSHSKVWPLFKSKVLIISLLFFVLLLCGFFASRFIVKNARLWLGFTPSQVQFLASDSTAWLPFVCNDGNFSAYYPGTPKPTSNIALTDLGELRITSYFCSSTQADSNFLYGVGYSVYPQHIMDEIDTLGYPLDLFFEGAISGTIDDSEATMLSSYFVDWHGYQGRAVVAELNSGRQLMVMRFYLVHNVMYCLQVLTQAQNYPNRAIDFFFDSFALLPGQSAGPNAD